jgi:uncharacterized protein YndB with AHSA1/START domain
MNREGDEDMIEINHCVEMNASPAQVYRALTQQAGPSGWWKRDARSALAVDSLAEFRFGELVVTMRVDALETGARVAWTCVEGPPDSVGTAISFELAPEGEGTVVRFRHRNWRASSDFMGRCSAKWAYFLFAMKSLLESPEPDDLYV